MMTKVDKLKMEIASAFNSSKIPTSTIPTKDVISTTVFEGGNFLISEWTTTSSITNNSTTTGDYTRILTSYTTTGIYSVTTTQKSARDIIVTPNITVISNTPVDFSVFQV
jgi:hypothetical protein